MPLPENRVRKAVLNWLQPESIVAPIIIAVIILIVCALIAVNMILLLSRST
jgi:hypothetical protein